MLSRWLRRCLIGELALLLVAVVLLVRSQVASPVTALGLGIAGLLALNASPFIIAMVCSACKASEIACRG